MSMKDVFRHTFIPLLQERLEEAGWFEMPQHSVDYFFPPDQFDIAELSALAMGGRPLAGPPRTQKEKIRDFCEEHEYSYKFDQRSGNLKIFAK